MSVSKLTPIHVATYNQERLDEALNDELSSLTITTFAWMSEELYIKYEGQRETQIEDLLKSGARPNKQSLKILNKQVKKIQKIRKRAETYLRGSHGEKEYSFFFYRSGVSEYRDLHHYCPDGLFEIDKINNMILEAYKPKIKPPSEELQKLQDKLYQL
ncbi:MAG: hypothetical protein K1060chlam3_00107 [Candidatus Anoxychlamydiales bacterium]|nr:hypothetical protein [Candidatus Anoxychlamydiales bacterium]